MDFSFSEEERLIGDSLASFFADTYDADARRKAITSDAGWRPDVWRALAQDLGVLGVALPEAAGGLGVGPVGVFVVMREMGKALVVEPFLETVVMGAGLLARVDSDAAREALSAIVAGELVVALAWGEPGGRFDPADVSTTARREGDGWRLDGRKAVVSAAPWASKLIVTARTGGGRRDTGGLSLFLVDKDASGVTTRDYPTVDGRRASEVEFDNVVLPADALLGAEGEAWADLEAVMDAARVALCAEACGVLGEMVRQTTDYARQRRQFGRPISEFQVLQHRMVDMQTELEQATSMAILAATFADGEDNDERSRIIAAAKHICARAARKVAEEAIQLHGGIGMTWEYNLAHHAKRLVMIAHQFGDDDHHLKAYAKLMQVA